VTPVVLGSVLAAYDGVWNWWLFFVTLAGAVAIHAGTNLINDYYDWKKGTDTQETLGPNRALKEGLLTPRQVFWGGVIYFALGSLLGLYLVATRGLFILYLGIFSVLATGLGEVVVFVFMGPVMVLGSYYVQALRISAVAVWLSVPVGLLVAAILHANNMRDLETDRFNKKRTLANLRWEYYLLVGGSYLLLVALVLLGVAPPAVLLALLTLPMAIDLIRTAAIHEAPVRLNRVLRGTATLHGRFGWLMIVGVVVAIAAQVA
jgi:1,4-dihydroxy-2-naphthoate octaprenyltransferase